MPAMRRHRNGGALVAGKSEMLNNALWQFNEAVSLLREARLYVPAEVSLKEEIDVELPAIQKALEAMANQQRAGW